MINEEAMAEIEELLLEYKRTWGKEVEDKFIPPGMTQEKLVVVLRRTVKTGESILVGWNKIYNKK